MEEVSKMGILAPFTFAIFFFRARGNLWTGDKGGARQKHRREKNSNRRSPRASAGRGGPIGHPVIPQQRINSILGKRMACPPNPRNDARLIILECTALASGPGNP
jgi:hypothetical protein